MKLNIFHKMSCFALLIFPTMAFSDPLLPLILEFNEPHPKWEITALRIHCRIFSCNKVEDLSRITYYLESQDAETQRVLATLRDAYTECRTYVKGINKGYYHASGAEHARVGDKLTIASSYCTRIHEFRSHVKKMWLTGKRNRKIRDEEDERKVEIEAKEAETKRKLEEKSRKEFARREQEQKQHEQKIRERERMDNEIKTARWMKQEVDNDRYRWRAAMGLEGGGHYYGSAYSAPTSAAPSYTAPSYGHRTHGLEFGVRTTTEPTYEEYTPPTWPTSSVTGDSMPVRHGWGSSGESRTAGSAHTETGTSSGYGDGGGYGCGDGGGYSDL